MIAMVNYQPPARSGYTVNYWGSAIVPIVAGLSIPLETIEADPNTAFNRSLLTEDSLFQNFFQQILALADDEEEDAPPSQFAINDVLELTSLSRVQLSQNWKAPHVATDGYGGIRLSWQNGRREVRALIPDKPTRKSYIYWEDGDLYDTVENFTAVTLYSFLDRLNREAPFGN